jgi:RNA polymerase sigma factor (TIGR02999 family)
MRESEESAPQPLDDFCPPDLREGVMRLAPMLYADLKRVARRERAKLFSPNTLTTTSLIHESYLKLSGQPGFESAAHFLRVAAVTMRHLLIDHVRAQLAAKRGGGANHVPIEDAPEGELRVEDDETVMAVHEALFRLAKFAPRLAEVVQCRYFAGYTNKEIAEALGVTERTVDRDWSSAKAWLAAELGESASRL